MRQIQIVANLPDVEILRLPSFSLKSNVSMWLIAPAASKTMQNCAVPRGFDLPAALSFGGQKAVSANAPSMLSVPNFRASRRVGIRSEIVFIAVPQ